MASTADASADSCRVCNSMDLTRSLWIHYAVSQCRSQFNPCGFITIYPYGVTTVDPCSRQRSRLPDAYAMAPVLSLTISGAANRGGSIGNPGLNGSGSINDFKNQEATLWIGNLDPAAINETLLMELAVQFGPVRSLHLPRDKVTQQMATYAFVEYENVESAEYAMKVMSHIKLHGRQVRINRASRERQHQDWFASVFVGNLNHDVDEKLLYDTFAQFGSVISARIMTDPETEKSRGFGFVQFETFEAADAAIAVLNGQYLANRPLNVSYAFKEDGSKQERHGSAEERLLAAKAAASKGLTSFPSMVATNTMIPSALLSAPPATDATPSLIQASSTHSMMPPGIPKFSIPPPLPGTSIPPSVINPYASYALPPGFPPMFHSGTAGFPQGVIPNYAAYSASAPFAPPGLANSAQNAIPPPPPPPPP